VTPIIKLSKRAKGSGWLTIDMRDDVDIGIIVVVPQFGRDHHCGMDCWCSPAQDMEGLVVHNAEH
jgi:hypothetical protein